MTRIVLIHGAATDSRIWQSAAEALRRTGAEVLAPDRPQSGSLETEVAFLAPLCAGAFVIGVSGGATLGLELAARGVELRGALLHEPAAGSLAPGLLRTAGRRLADDGVAGFGSTLYGPRWTTACTRVPLATVQAEFAMFSAFEPAPLGGNSERVLLTVGEHSPEARHRAVADLAQFLGVRHRTLPGVGHAAHLEGAIPHAWHFLSSYSHPEKEAS